MQTTAADNLQPRGGQFRDHISIARPDHWFKNVFMLIGICFAYLYRGKAPEWIDAGVWLWAFVATCLIASSNYVINEILDAATDRFHPTKRDRPIPTGRVKVPIAYVEWFGLTAVGLGMAWFVNPPFFIAAALLWLMGVVYNVRPLRSKDLPYVDVLTEAVNNPLRLALGWFVVNSVAVPPMSAMISYWMLGAFFMASKRFAEYRFIGDAASAATYRASFRRYDETNLLTSTFFYAVGSAIFLGIFIVRYRLELILCTPFVAGAFSYYLSVTMKPQSAVQNPERLYRERGLVAYLVFCIAIFILLWIVPIDAIYEWFNVAQPDQMPPLWKIR